MREKYHSMAIARGRKTYRRYYSLVGVVLMGFLVGQSISAQLPQDLPWPGSIVDGRTVIVQPGISAVSCGTTVSTADPSERFTFGLMNVDRVVPVSGRTEENVQEYHHPSWLVTEVGNIFGVAINERTGDMLLGASSNYGAGFLGEPSVLRYGDIGGGANSLSAAGTVYRADAVTGQATVFAVLPQQPSTFTHVDCEGNDSQMRTTGVGLGNIHYDQLHDQYFVTNIEDGRIYRLGPSGDILDSYDPGALDDGAAGISSLTDLVYGVAVEPGGQRLFFGGVSTAGSVPLWSIDLSATGGFVGSIDNTALPAGADWQNYVGVETIHTDVTAEIIGTPKGPTFHLISDLEFTPDSRLLVGIRVGCNSSWFTSYNHGGESNVISSDSNGVYDALVTEFDVSVDGFRAAEDAYGGVAHYRHIDGSVDFVVSSADILEEDGPHGLAVFHSVDAARSPIEPLAALSYGVVDIDDPKGVGGSVDVYSGELCGEIRPRGEILCDRDGSGDFTLKLIVRNLTQEEIHHLFIFDADPSSSVEVVDDYINFPERFGQPLGVQGDSSTGPPWRPITLKVKGATPGEPLELLFTLHNENLEMCCSKEWVIEVPACDCAQLRSLSTCPAFSDDRSRSFTFYIDNLSTEEVSHIFITPIDPPDATFTPNHFRTPVDFLGPIKPGESAGSFGVTVDGPNVAPGSEIEFLVSIHDQFFGSCCPAQKRKILLPASCAPIGCQAIGAATARRSNGRFVVGDISVHGPFEDGYACYLNRPAEFDATWLPLDRSILLPNGAGFEMTTTRASGTGGVDGLGTVQTVLDGDGLTISADLSSIDSPTQRIEIYRRDQLATVIRGNTEPVRVSRLGGALWPTQGRKIGGLGQTTCYVQGWDDLVEFEVAGNTIWVGDELRILSEGPQDERATLESFTFRASGIPEVVVTEANQHFDCNQNGVPDRLDLESGVSFDEDADGLPDECRREDLEVSLNTGFDQAAGALIAAGEEDSDWRVVNAQPARVASVVSNPVGAWPDPLPDSQWISIDPNRGFSVPGIPSPEFETCFCLSPAASEPSLQLQLSADDRASVWLNGNPVGGPSGGLSPLEVLVSQPDLFQAGENCILVRVEDLGGYVTGLNLEGTVRATNGLCLSARAEKPKSPDLPMERPSG